MMPINFSTEKLPSPKQLASKDLWNDALIEGKVTKPTANVRRAERYYRKMLEAIQNFTVTCGEGTGKTLSQAVDELQALRPHIGIGVGLGPIGSASQAVTEAIESIRNTAGVSDGDGWYLIQSKAGDTPMAEVRDAETTPPDDLTLNCATCPEDVLKVEFMTWGTEHRVYVEVCDGDDEDKVFTVSLNTDSALKLRDWLNQYLQYSQTQEDK